MMKKIAGIVCASMLICLYGLEEAQGQPLQGSSVVKEATKGHATAKAIEERIRGFSLKEAGNVRLIVKSAVSPTLKISSYSTGSEKMMFIIGCLVATGAGLVFVAPLATVPAVVGPLANAAAGTAAVGVSAGEAFGIDYLLGHSRARVMKEAVASVNMVAALQGSLEQFLAVRDMKAGDTRSELEVIIAGYGFHTAPNDEACSFIDVRTILKVSGRDPIEDKILLGWTLKDDDIPPPYCTALKRFMEKEGLLARQAMLENAEIAAAVIAKRLQRRQP